MVQRNRLAQIFAREEVTPGTFLSPYSATYAAYVVIDPSMTSTPKFFERNFKRSTLSRPMDIVGMREGTLRFTIEIAGEAASTPDVPPWDLFMRACGLKSVATSFITTNGSGLTNGPLRHGETITQTTTLATAIVLHDVTDANAAQTVYVQTAAITGSPNSSAVWTGGNGATFTPTTAPADAGQSWYPKDFPTSNITYAAGSLTGTMAVGMVVKGSVATTSRAVIIAHDTTAETMTLRYYSLAGGVIGASSESVQDVAAPGTNFATTATLVSSSSPFDIPTLSLAIDEDGVLRTLYAARGTCSFQCRVGEPVLATFEFRGVWGAPSASSDQPMITSGITFRQKVPPVFTGTTAGNPGANFKLGTEGDTDTTSEYAARISAMTLTLGNTLALRESAGASDGYETCEITERNVTGTIDPEGDLEASYPMWQNFYNATPMRLMSSWGASAGNKFYLSMPGAQITGLDVGDRQGLMIRNVPFKATAGYYSTETPQTIPGENEFCLTYLVV